MHENFFFFFLFSFFFTFCRFSRVQRKIFSDMVSENVAEEYLYGRFFPHSLRKQVSFIGCKRIVLLCLYNVVSQTVSHFILFCDMMTFVLLDVVGKCVI